MRRLPHWLALAITLAVMTTAAVTLLFSTFMLYDDEGYVLWSLNTFIEHGRLYDLTYSQYGPFFFLFHQALHLAGVAFTNLGARWLALAWWLGASGFCGALVWRLTRSTPATVFALTASFLHLWRLSSEPSHPGGLVSLLVALLAWAGVRWMERPQVLAAITGAIGAALLLTKINVGAFAVIAAGAWWLLHLDSPALSLRWQVALVGLALAALPPVLMHNLLAADWAMVFALVAASSAVAVALAAGAGAEPRTQWRNLVPLVATAAGVVALTCILTVARGTTWRGLLDGVLLEPARHPAVFFSEVRWRPGALAVAAVSLALACWCSRIQPTAPRRWLAVARVVALGALLVTWWEPWGLNMHAFSLSYALALTWLFVLPLDADRGTQAARAWLGLLVVLQALHAYPVAGSQIGWGTFLWVPLAVLGMYDARRVLTAWAPGWRISPDVAALGLAAAVAVGHCAKFAQLGYQRMRDSDALGLPGAESIRLPESVTTAARTMAVNAVVHGDMLFTLPGMLSFHPWSTVPPPTTVNTTHWFSLLSAERQAAIRTRLEAAPRSVVIAEQSLYRHLQTSGFNTESELTRWLHQNYRAAFKIENYEFWVRTGRAIAPMNTARIFAADAETRPPYKLSLTLVIPNRATIHAIDISRLQGDSSVPLAEWKTAGFTVTHYPINTAGAPSGPAQPGALPLTLEGLVRVEFLIDQLPPGTDPASCVVHLRDASGIRVGEARFITDAP